MKKIYLIAISFLAVACEGVDEVIDNDPIVDEVIDEVIDIDNISGGDIDDLLLKCDEAVDGNAVFDAISQNGVVFGGKFEVVDGEWMDLRAPGGIYFEGFVFEDNSCTFYGYTPVVDETGSAFTNPSYESGYDPETATIFTKSLCHDFTYSAKVIYFKDNTIIFDGVLGSDDYANEDYAERRYIYLCTLDSEAPAEWEKRINE